MDWKLLLSTIFIASIEGVVKCEKTNYVTICYWSSWIFDKFNPLSMDSSLCTHLVTIFATIKDNRMEFTNYGVNLSKIKNMNKDIKIILAVGGAAEGPKHFSALAENQTTREIFINSGMDLLKKHKFDGLILHWFWPGDNGNKADKENYSLLVKEFSEKLKSENLFFSAAVDSNPWTFKERYNVTEISKYLDFIIVATIDLYGFWNDDLNHPNYLYAGKDGENNANESMVAWVNAGAPKSKLVMSVSFQSTAFKLTQPSENYIGAKRGDFLKGTAGENAVYTYFEVCPYFKSNKTKVSVFDMQRQVSYLATDEFWFGHPDEFSLYYKIQYIMKNNFAGVMIWRLEMDDHSNRCNCGTFPLLKLIKSSFKNPNQINKCVMSTAYSNHYHQSVISFVILFFVLIFILK